MKYEKEDLILLNMAGIGKKTLEKLSGADLRRKIASIQKEHNLETELKLIKKHNVEIITISDNSYPKILKEIHSPPLVLYVKGKILKEGELGIAIVGSRFASIYGTLTAERLGYELVSGGLVVVSGLARGVDTAGHRGAVKAHGKTVAVLGNGLNTVYPPENKRFAIEIVEKGGALISEFPMDTPPLGRNFPIRNRIISGLSLAVIVVEAAKNSGALITADFALEQGREVFAVPGGVNSATSIGTNRLIKEGAKLIQDADDVMEELQLRPKERTASKLCLSSDEKVIYEVLSDEPKYIDEVREGSGLALNKTVELLFSLQFKGLAKELPGKNFVKAK